MSRILHDTGTHSGNSGLQGQVKVKLGNRKVGIKVTEGESRKVDEPIEQVSQKSKGLRTETKASVKLSEGTKLTERQQCTGNFQRSHSQFPDKPTLLLGVKWARSECVPLPRGSSRDRLSYVQPL